MNADRHEEARQGPKADAASAVSDAWRRLLVRWERVASSSKFDDNSVHI